VAAPTDSLFAASVAEPERTALASTSCGRSTPSEEVCTHVPLAFDLAAGNADVVGTGAGRQGQRGRGGNGGNDCLDHLLSFTQVKAPI
jgi:hypothetical protein